MTGFQIQIPQDYFARSAAKDYADDAGLALVREFSQNSADAGATVVAFSFDAATNTLTVRDDGRGCDDRRMRNKLLVPLESEKEADAVGGFGKAKELLLFGNESWVLRTRDLRVQGSLLTVQSYEQGLEHHAGFTAEVKLPPGLFRAARENARRFLSRSQRPGLTWLLDGEPVGCAVERPARCTKDFGFAKAYLNRGIYDPRVYLRTGGLLTASRYGHHDANVGQVIIEVTGRSTDLLTPARDWFRHDEHRRAVDNWLHALSTNARRALREETGDELIFDDQEMVEEAQDTGLRAALPRGADGQEIEVAFRQSLPVAPATVGGTSEGSQAFDAGLGLTEAAQAAQDGQQAQVRVALPARRDGFDLRLVPQVPSVKRLVVHTGSKAQAKVAMRWLRKPRYQARAARLLAAWTTAVRALAAAATHKVDAVGFTFAEDAEGEFVRARNGRFGLLINPMKFTFKGRFQAQEVLDLALHEAAHQVASGDHDEAFVLGEFALRRQARDPRILRAIARALKSGQVESL